MDYTSQNATDEEKSPDLIHNWLIQIQVLGGEKSDPLPCLLGSLW